MPEDAVALFVLGLLVLGVGSELLARGLGWVARAFGSGSSADAVAVTAGASSAPVLAVCLALALSHYPRAALATVIGANVANVGLVLGIAAVVRPLAGRSPILRPAVLALLAVTLLVWFLARDGDLSRVDAVLLFAVFVLAVGWLVRFARKEKSDAAVAAPGVAGLGMVLLPAGIAGLLGGAALVARSLAGVAQPTGGITVAVAVLAPALTMRPTVAGVVAARRGEADAVLGGAVGASVLNLLLVLGVLAVVAPVPVPPRVLAYELPALAVSAALLLPVLANGLRLPRWEGLVLFTAYCGFVAWELGYVWKAPAG